MTSTPVLLADNLARRFRSVEAVAEISLSIQKGEVVGLLGPNGSGKSTTMKLLAGVLRPTNGSINIAGVDALSQPLEAKRLTGFVPDVAGLFPRLTGWEHMELAARFWELEKNWDKPARSILERLDLADAAGRRASTYSHGMSRKLSVAIAVLSSPRLLLLDEPFDGVDPSGASAVKDLIEGARSSGTGTLVSTHLLDVAERLCDNVLIIRSGRVIAKGSPTEIVQENDSLEKAYMDLLRSPS